MKLGIILFVLMFSLSAMADISMTVQCSLEESSGKTSNHIKTQYQTLSDQGQMSFAVSPTLSMDRGAIYLLSLSKGNIYKDAIGDEIGAQYFLSLNRIQNRTKTLHQSKISGKTQDMLTIVSKQGQENQVSYRNDQGKLISKAPQNLNLSYKLRGRRKINFTCEII